MLSLLLINKSSACTIRDIDNIKNEHDHVVVMITSNLFSFLLRVYVRVYVFFKQIEQASQQVCLASMVDEEKKKKVDERKRKKHQ